MVNNKDIYLFYLTEPISSTAVLMSARVKLSNLEENLNSSVLVFDATDTEIDLALRYSLYYLVLRIRMRTLGKLRIRIRSLGKLRIRIRTLSKLRIRIRIHNWLGAAVLFTYLNTAKRWLVLRIRIRTLGKLQIGIRIHNWLGSSCTLYLSQHNKAATSVADPDTNIWQTSDLELDP